MRTTKEALIKENAALKEQITKHKIERDAGQIEDRRVRETFAKVIRVDSAREPYSRTTGTPSWEEIFFTVGEINSGAHYRAMQEEHSRLRDQINELMDQINNLKQLAREA